MYKLSLVVSSENGYFYNVLGTKKSNDVTKLYKFLDSNKLKIFDYYEQLALYAAQAIAEAYVKQQTKQTREILELGEKISEVEEEEDNSEKLDQCYYMLIKRINKLMQNRELCKFVLEKLAKYNIGIEFEELN